MSLTRVDIWAAKGKEETLDPDFYALCGGVWIEEQGTRVLIKCYPTDVPALLAYLDRSELSMHDVAVVEEEEKDYVALVRRQFRPIKIGQLTILPPWRKKRPSGQTITIEPGMAFGTGRHESTKLMIRMMGGIDIRGKKVLDVGSGSGILAIYARLLGAASVVAVDNDPLAAEAAKKSADLNQAYDIRIVCSGIENIKGRFQTVLANLDFNTFRLHGTKVAQLVDDGGVLVISGIERQFAADTPALFASLSLVRKTKMKDWHGFVFRKG